MKKQAFNAGKDHRVRKVDQPEAAKPARIVDVSDDPVLARIGLKAWNHATSRWSREILTWFCETSQKDLNRLSEGDWLSIQEEITRLCALINHEENPKPIARGGGELPDFQQEVLRRLRELADEGRTVFSQPEGYVVLEAKGTGAIAFHKSTVRGLDGLIGHFGWLLERWLEQNRTLVRRCPLCSRIFIQQRSHAQYCSRQCQSRAASKGK